MALVSGGRSRLNPDAPLFIPAALRQVEDFSPEWWELVQTSKWYRDYWMSQHPEENFDGNSISDEEDVANLLPDDLGIDEDIHNFEAQSVEPYWPYGAKQVMGSALYASLREMKPLNGLEMDVGAMMMNLNQCKSPNVRGSPKSPIFSAKYNDKPVQRLSPKPASRRIHQPR
ncbi:hypothetical protein RJ641_005041 [Dillenia turbinata]|uniref:Ataxin-2 C-terminal domain-containing protein n=1 Tax=Dillenia turbinata TaxID=194707 RepID=A0AAN8VF66_9MAGN